MIDIRFPDLEKLKPEEQLELASKLAQKAMASLPQTELSPEGVRLLEKRLDYFNRHPESGISWDQLRNQRDDS